MFSQTTDYALRAMVVLGSDPTKAWKHAEIARVTKVPPDYLSKVLQSLARTGLVHSQRGAGGGFSLARPPAEITILDVLNAVDPIQRIQRCPLGLRAHGARLCALHKKLDEALAHVEQAFASSTLADILSDKDSGKPRPCEFPMPPPAR